MLWWTGVRAACLDASAEKAASQCPTPKNRYASMRIASILASIITRRRLRLQPPQVRECHYTWWHFCNEAHAHNWFSCSATVSLTLSHSLSLVADLSGWLRDLTREGIEPNPGHCQDGAAAAPCKCSLTKEELVQAGHAAVGGTCPDCNHKVSMHTSSIAPAHEAG
jgi:hypothetical protein